MALVLSLSPPVQAQYDYLETDDLLLVYYRPIYSFIAPYTAQCFENAMRFHKHIYGWEPSEKVTVSIVDIADYGNAAAWSSPRNGLMIQIAPANFVYETGPSNERINFAMNHEVAHLVTQDQAAGSDQFFRTMFRGKVKETADHPESILFGYLTLPRRAAPRWYREGIAVFMETWMAGGLGRAQGPYDEMVFRSMVRDGSRFYDPLGLESEGAKVDFQGGVNSYLYGTRFYCYLAYRYGPEKLIKWTRRTEGSRQYFAAQFRHVYGRSVDEVWRDWVAWEHDFQQANLDTIRRYPTTPYRDLSPVALGSVSRGWVDPDGRTLYAGVNYPGAVPHIAAIDLEGGPVRRLQEVKGPALYFVCAVALDPDTRTLFYTTDNNEWRDLMALDLATGRARRLIRDARIGDLAFNRSDRSLWGVRHFNGISTVVRLAAPYEEWNQIHSFPYGTDVYDLDVSPDGTLLSASFAEISGRQTLRVMDMAALMRRDATARTLHDFDKAIPTGFVFDPDGRYLYGSSYYTGVSNIWRYDLAADSMDIVTNTETGFFRPVPLGGDSLVVFRFSGEGFVPARVEARPLTDVNAITLFGATVADAHPVVKTWRVPPPSAVNLDSLTIGQGAYRPLRRLSLDGVYPIVEGYRGHTAVGLHASFSDPASLHAFDVTVSYTGSERAPENQRWHLETGYARYNLSARAYYNPASFYDLVGPTKSSRKGYGASLEYTRVLLRDLPRKIEASVSLGGWGGLDRLPDFQDVSTPPGFERLLDGNLRLKGEHLRSSMGAVDHEKGHRWQIISGLNLVRFQRQDWTVWQGFPQNVGALDVGVPLPLAHSSVWLRSAAGYSPGPRDEPFANFYFGAFGNNWVDHQEPRRYRGITSFPGTEIDAIAGTNFGRTTLEWCLPPLRFERLGSSGFYGTWLRTAVFAGGLFTNLEDSATRRRVFNAGIQSDLRLQLLTRQQLTLSFGYARSFEHRRRLDDEWMVSLKIL